MDLTGGLGIELLAVPGSSRESKQTRSLSRGKPQPAANNLIQKANAINPNTSTSKSKLISPRGTEVTVKKSIMELEIC